jgi:hypothetical protein
MSYSTGRILLSSQSEGQVARYRPLALLGVPLAAVLLQIYLPLLLPFLSFLFCAVEPNAGRHFTFATPDRCAFEFAVVVRELALHYLQATPYAIRMMLKLTPY